MPRADVFHTQTYDDQLAELESDDLFERVVRLEEEISAFPDMGSPLARESLARRYGVGIRKMNVGRYLLVYRHAGDKVIMLGLVPARGVK